MGSYHCFGIVPRDGILAHQAMRSIAETTRTLIRRLQELCWGREKQTADPQEKQRLLEQIGRAKDPASVPWLMGVLYGGGSEVADMAAATINEIVQASSPIELARLDGQIREMSEWRYPAILASEVGRLACGLTGTLGVFSFSGSGHTRESAVRLLAEVNDGEELPFLLIRLNDWVKPVRDAAHRAVTARIRPEYADHFIRNLPLVFRLPDQSRATQEVFAAITKLLRSSECRERLRQAVKAPDHLACRPAFRLLVEEPQEDYRDVLQSALASNDTVLRLWAARDLRRVLDGQALEATLARLNMDRFMPVRREALYGYVEKLPERAKAELTRSLLDRHASMRETGRFYLRKMGQQDFAQFYRDSLQAEGDELASAIAGMGETGVAADAQRLAGFLDHANARVRRATVGAIGHLNTTEFVEQLLRAVEDPSPAVAKVARSVLLLRPHMLPPQRLWTIFQSTGSAHTRRIVLSLIAALRWWDAAPRLMMATASDDQKLRDVAMDRLHRWLRNSSRLVVRPTREQLELLRSAMDLHGSRLDHSIRQDVSSVLSSAEREQS